MSLRARAKLPLILIVDDDATTAHLLGRLLRIDGYDTNVATDGAVALTRLSRHPVPDALITDFHLANTNGLAVGRYARAQRPAMPIFVITGDPKAVEAAADPLSESIVLVTKPIDYTDLVTRLRAAFPTPRVDPAR